MAYSFTRGVVKSRSNLLFTSFHVGHSISVRSSPRQPANAEAFAEAYLCYLVSALAKKMPRQLNSLEF